MSDMENRKINILGTEYRIETHKVSEDSYLEENKLAGYCGEEEKLIVVADMSEEKYFTGMDEKAQETYRKRVLRHEIVHAFLNESGLSDSSNQYGGAWAKNEEMVDWFAIQSLKIFKVYSELGLLEGCSASKTIMTADGATMVTACGNADEVVKVLNKCALEGKSGEKEYIIRTGCERGSERHQGD